MIATTYTSELLPEYAVSQARSVGEGRFPRSCVPRPGLARQRREHWPVSEQRH